MSQIINTYLAGGVEFMHPITILLVINLAIAGYLIYSKSSGKPVSANWIEAIKQVGGFAAATGTFGTLVGLFLAFNALEQSEQVIPFQVIMGGLKVSLITVLYGLIVFLISMIIYIIFKMKQPSATHIG